MKKLCNFFGIIAIGAVIGFTLAGCKDPSGGGCKGDGACYYIKGNSDYKWCGAESCAVWETSDTGQASISCNCN